MATPRYQDNPIDTNATITANQTSSPYASPPFYRTGSPQALLLASCAGASGTSPTLTYQLQGSMDGITWFNVGASSQFTGAGSNSREFVAFLPFYQVVKTVGGTSPSFTGVNTHLLFEAVL